MKRSNTENVAEEKDSMAKWPGNWIDFRVHREDRRKRVCNRKELRENEPTRPTQ